MNVTAIPALLDERQAAAYLGFSLSTLRRFRAAGSISYIRPSPRKIRFRQDHLDQFIADREVQCKKNNDSSSGNSGSPNDRMGLRKLVYHLVPRPTDAPAIDAHSRF